MRQISQHHLTESLLKARSVQDLLHFPGCRDSCSNLLEVTWENLSPVGRHAAVAHTFSGPAMQLAVASAPAITLEKANTAELFLVSPAFS